MKADARSRSRGFTLLEMMAAVAILAVASSAVFFSNSAALNAQAKLEEQTVAQWALANQSAYYELASRIDSSGMNALASATFGTQRVNVGGYDLEIRSAAEPIAIGGINQMRWEAYRLIDGRAIGPILSLTTWSDEQ